MAQAARSTQRPNEGHEGDLRRGPGSSVEAQHDLVFFLKQFAHENPSSAALWCFVIGFIVGWKLKPW